MPSKKLDIQPIVLESMRVKFPYTASGTIPGWRVKCHQCSIEFEVTNYNLRKGYGLFCSRHCSGRYRRRTPKEVLMSHIEKRPNGCWEFTGATMPYGHGQLTLAGGERWLAHRLSWEVHVGPIPEDTNVCHQCDNPPCVNPDHLFLGSQMDNMQDAGEKGRMGKHKRKLTRADVEEILVQLKNGRTQKEMGEKYGVSRGAISEIARNRNWKHIPRP